MVCLGTGCDAVRASAYSHLWSIPMPVFGVAGYLAVAILIIAESLLSAPLAKWARYAVAGMTACGFLFSLYLEYLQGFVIHAFCAWCVTSGLAMTGLCGLAIYNLVRPAPEPGPPAQLAQVRSHFVLCLVALLVGVPAFYLLARHGELPPQPPQASREALAEKLGERYRKLLQACEVANRDGDVLEFERDFDALTDPICEPWEPGSPVA